MPAPVILHEALDHLMDTMRAENRPQQFVAIIIKDIPMAILSLMINCDPAQVAQALGPDHKGPMDIDSEMRNLTRRDVEDLDSPPQC